MWHRKVIWKIYTQHTGTFPSSLWALIDWSRIAKHNSKHKWAENKLKAAFHRTTTERGNFITCTWQHWLIFDQQTNYIHNTMRQVQYMLTIYILLRHTFCYRDTSADKITIQKVLWFDRCPNYDWISVTSNHMPMQRQQHPRQWRPSAGIWRVPAQT